MQQPQSLTLKQQAKTLARGFLQLGLPYAECVHAFKREFIVLVLVAHRGNQCRAAHALCMHRNTLARTLVELKIDARLIRSVFLKNAGLKLASGSRTGLRTGLQTTLRTRSRTDARSTSRNVTSPAAMSEAQIERRKLVLVTTAVEGNPVSRKTVAHDNPASPAVAQRTIAQNMSAQGVITKNNPVSV